MLSWSAQETSRQVDLRPIAGGDGEPGLPGGRELVELGRAVRGNGDGAHLYEALAAKIGREAATDAAAVAANFEIMNRVVDAVGLPVGTHRRQQAAPIIEALGLNRFPHASIQG